MAQPRGHFSLALVEVVRDKKIKMQNAKCKIGGSPILHFAFCILNLLPCAFCIFLCAFAWNL